MRPNAAQTRKGTSWSTATLLLTNLMIFQVSYNQGRKAVRKAADEFSPTGAAASKEPQQVIHQVFQADGVPMNHTLHIPLGLAEALPSVREEAKVVDRKNIYGGQGDKQHLGGFVEIDFQGIAPNAWRYMVEEIGVHSLVDVGCGRGISTSWFLFNGVDALCVEGSHNAWENTMLPSPDKQMVEHDFSRGPWWPSKTYDAIWCVEFLEHVGRNFHKNYLPTFRKAAIIFASHSNWGGWHHVEVHKDPWWKLKMEMYGFKYSEELTTEIRSRAKIGQSTDASAIRADSKYNGQHVWLTMMVFINPLVASLPQHSHLMAELGCYKDRKDGVIIHRECGPGQRGGEAESVLPDEYKALKLDEAKQVEWEKWVHDHVQPVEAK